jgi:hypothetical protein
VINMVDLPGKDARRSGELLVTVVLLSHGRFSLLHIVPRTAYLVLALVQGQEEVKWSSRWNCANGCHQMFSESAVLRALHLSTPYQL